MTTSLPSNSSPHTKPFPFSSLPPELRSRIWELTLKPRILLLHTHRPLAPYITDGGGGVMDAPYETLSISFSATVLPERLTPDQAFAAYAASSPHRGTLTYKLPSPNVPALFTCHESRQVAIAAGYELAFPGTDINLLARDTYHTDRRAIQQRNQEIWNERKLAEAKTWVNFKTDIIFVDLMDRPRLYSKTAVCQPFALLRSFAAEEVRKVRKLAVGCWGLHARRDISQHLLEVARFQDRYVDGKEGLRGFSSLSDIIVDDGFVNPRFTESMMQTVNGLERRWGRGGREPFSVAWLEDALKEKTRIESGWMGSVPTVQNIKGQEWMELLKEGGQRNTI